MKKVENLKPFTCSCGCPLSSKIIIWLIWYTSATLWTQTCQNFEFFWFFFQKKSKISVKNQDIENPKTWTDSCGCLLSYIITIPVIWCMSLKLQTQTCPNFQFSWNFRQKKSNISVKNPDIENLKTSARSWGCLLSY